MSFRRNAAKPSVALWMLVAIGDVVLLLVAAGMTALAALASVVTVAVAAVGAALLLWRASVGRTVTSTSVDGALRTGGRVTSQQKA